MGLEKLFRLAYIPSAGSLSQPSVEGSPLGDYAESQTTESSPRQPVSPCWLMSPKGVSHVVVEGW